MLFTNLLRFVNYTNAELGSKHSYDSNELALIHEFSCRQLMFRYLIRSFFFFSFHCFCFHLPQLFSTFLRTALHFYSFPFATHAYFESLTQSSAPAHMVLIVTYNGFSFSYLTFVRMGSTVWFFPLFILSLFLLHSHTHAQQHAHM